MGADIVLPTSLDGGIVCQLGYYMAKDIRKMRWMVTGTSIQTEDQVEVTFDLTGRKKVHLSVAFNVGRDIAHHIVYLHNNQLKDKGHGYAD